MGKFQDLTGECFGRLTVKERAENIGRSTAWRCICNCGNEVIVCATNLKNGATKSCGCLCAEIKKSTHTVHGDTGNRLYRVFMGMKNRCYNSKSKSYADYGGRGICVCDEWVDNYQAFREWAVNNGYFDNLTIDRIDVNGDYSPSNCRWTTRKEQANNTRKNNRITFNGEEHTLSEWADIVGVRYGTLRMRLHYGWSIERTLTTTGRCKN